jgi:hypothetical protein
MRHNQRDIKSKRTIKLAKLNLENLAARRWQGVLHVESATAQTSCECVMRRIMAEKNGL